MEEARRQILAAVPRLESESVAIDGHLSGRVLAADVRARVTLPPFDNSAMDGYAVRAEDVARVPVRLPVRGEMAAGMAPGAVRVEPGSCAKVMTGAPLPVGADAVVPYEWTDHGDREVRIERAPRAGNAVRRRGEDLRPDDLVLAAGARIRPTDLSALAGCGWAQLQLGRRPRVALASTGDELLPPGAELRPGAIYDTAGVALEAQIAAAGGELVARLRVPDDPEVVERELLAAAGAADVLVTVGGVSVGDHDHVRATVERRGRLRLWRVAMRPGRPIAFGELAGAVFLGLPGNPVSASVTFILFGAPALLAMQGGSNPLPPQAWAELLEPVDKPDGLETFHRATLEPRPGQIPGVRLAGGQSSGVTRSLSQGDVLLVLPAAGALVTAGTRVSVIPL